MLLADLAVAPVGAADVVVTGLALDSRTVAPGNLWVALPGQRAHGAQFVDTAVTAGAAVVLTDEVGSGLVGDRLPVVVVADPRLTMADLAARFHGYPSQRLTMLGVTGTNGKTTTTFLLEAALAAAGHRVGTIGTIGFRLAGEPVEVARTTVTTPESLDLQALLARFVGQGADAVVMEVSSHALALERVRAVGFDVAGFTNLGRDHLDFHPTLEDYFETKARLFEPDRCRHAVVMTTDDHGRLLASRLRAAKAPALTTVGTAADDDIRLLSSEPTPEGGTRVRIAGALGERELSIDLPGAHNGRNAVLALAMAAVVGVDPDQAMAGLRHAQVPGRMQRIPLGPPRQGEQATPTVFVDFAHTPQAIEEAVRVGDQFSRTAVVVGAGGDRDSAKRSMMGGAAAHADLVVVTDDNPRTEDPARIRLAVEQGARAVAETRPGATVVQCADRAAAIAHALRWAEPDDVVLVLGKGHEQGQIVGDRVLPFDDADVVVEEWAMIAREQS
ncbi:UDP-N-acetylmuramoyl-L-alanyl-D-glutamate--2,6-diaminopimelate ligase [Aestuariimicrobium sp. T2.26MG-19.2B]|nr:UDP-N-acetylmuramoyl-L-alanyl-D-glutamate--2,6-diaminopimelate ligase [Aestuariimicrobium sp. T2.26MG-19.2B]